MKIGSIVKFKNRKWLYVDNIKNKAFLKLMPNEKEYIQNYKSQNLITTNIENLIPVDL